MFDVLCLVTAVLLADMHACVGHCKNGTYTFCLIKHSIIKGKSSRFNQKFIQHKYWKKRSLLFVFLLPNARYFICMWQEQKHVSGYKVTSLCVCVSVCVCVCMHGCWKPSPLHLSIFFLTGEPIPWRTWWPWSFHYTDTWTRQAQAKVLPSLWTSHHHPLFYMLPICLPGVLRVFILPWDNNLVQVSTIDVLTLRSQCVFVMVKHFVQDQKNFLLCSVNACKFFPCIHRAYKQQCIESPA